MIKLYVFWNLVLVLFGKLIIILFVIVKFGKVLCNFVNCFENLFIVYLCFICFNIVFELDCNGICKWCIIFVECFKILIILFVSWFVLIEEIWICFNLLIVLRLCNNWVKL